MTHYDVSSAEGLAPVGRILAAIQRSGGDAARDLLLVGAVARDLHVHFVADYPIQRITHDVDFAVMAPSWDVYDALMRGVGRQKVRHRAVIEGWQVDIVPFGPLEAPPGVVSFEDDAEMSVIGFEEALISADTFGLPGDVVVKVPTPAALSVLKILAWIDRGRATDKDARDLTQLLSIYTAPCWTEHLYSAGLPHLARHDYEVVHGAVALLGAEAADSVAPDTMAVVRSVDRARLTAQMFPYWSEPGFEVSDVAFALDLFLGGPREES